MMRIIVHNHLAKRWSHDAERLPPDAAQIMAKYKEHTINRLQETGELTRAQAEVAYEKFNKSKRLFSPTRLWVRNAAGLKDTGKDGGLRKTTIAKEAARQLEFIREMLTESGNWDVGGVEYHANSVNNYIKSLQAAGQSVPDWITRNAGFFRAHNWRW